MRRLTFSKCFMQQFNPSMDELMLSWRLLKRPETFFLGSNTFFNMSMAFFDPCH